MLTLKSSTCHRWKQERYFLHLSKASNELIPPDWKSIKDPSFSVHTKYIWNQVIHSLSNLLIIFDNNTVNNTVSNSLIHRENESVQIEPLLICWRFMSSTKDSCSFVFEEWKNNHCQMPKSAYWLKHCLRYFSRRLEDFVFCSYIQTR